jgi:hypothetical protein
MGEMKRGASPPSRKATRARVRAIWWLLAGGALLALAGPLFAYGGLYYSGELVLAQKVSAGEIVRGFDFGPVYLQSGQPGRYFLAARLPDCPEGIWQTSFEVLNSRKQPVYREDELRFIGDHQFQPGQLDREVKGFTLDRETGYYYFRFTALNGSYPAVAGDPPVAQFAIRQRVLSGAWLWGPAAGLLAVGCLLFSLGVRQVQALGGLEQPAARRAARRPRPLPPVVEPPAPAAVPRAAGDNSPLLRRRRGFSLGRD